MSPRFARVLIVGVVVAGSIGVGAAVQSAKADCVAGDVYLTTSEGGPVYLIPADTCLVPTPFTTTVTGGQHASQPGLPPGTPNGAGFDAKVPAP